VNASRRRRSPLRGSVGCARRARCDSACYAICGSWARCSRSLTRVIRTSAARGGMCSFCAGTTERDLFLRAQTATITLGHRGQVWSVVRVVAQWSHPVGPTQNPVRLKPRVGSTPTSGTIFATTYALGTRCASRPPFADCARIVLILETGASETRAMCTGSASAACIAATFRTPSAKSRSDTMA